MGVFGVFILFYFIFGGLSRIVKRVHISRERRLLGSSRPGCALCQLNVQVRLYSLLSFLFLSPGPFLLLLLLLFRISSSVNCLIEGIRKNNRASTGRKKKKSRVRYFYVLLFSLGAISCETHTFILLSFPPSVKNNTAATKRNVSRSGGTRKNLPLRSLYRAQRDSRNTNISIQILGIECSK